MKIENLKVEKKGNKARVAATVIWEDCGRPTGEVFIETDEAFAQSLSCNPHAFLVGCAIPAMHFGEERVFIDAEICPELRNGLITAMSWIRHWYYDSERNLVRIEAKTRSSLSIPRPERAGFFFSGGIDSFATLRANRLSFPSQHPWSIKDGLLVYGLEIDQIEAFDHVVHSLSGIAQDIGITIIPVYTNLYLDYRQEDTADNFSFWGNEFQGAAFSAIAHAFDRRLTMVCIAGGSDISNLGPSGTHPLLDPNYGSIDLRVRHDGIALSRLAKTKLVADWDVALQHLRVCNLHKLYKPGVLNCGRCPKCVKTMLALLALGVLDKTRAFPEKELSPELILRGASIYDDYSESSYRELIPPLLTKGRHDLVRAIEYKISEYHNRESGWKAKIRQLDRKYLNSNLKRLLSYTRRNLRQSEIITR
ncbi:MAG: hypothetical protein M1508_07175 [Nitrospirae bacterium]|nr:hypothetical protein [Nitrospirota bacterium]